MNVSPTYPIVILLKVEWENEMRKMFWLSLNEIFTYSIFFRIMRRNTSNMILSISLPSVKYNMNYKIKIFFFFIAFISRVARRLKLVSAI